MALAKHSRSSPLIGVAARATLAAAAVLPMAAIQRLGSLLGSLAWRVPGRLREVSRLNVAMCLPELSREQRDRMVRLSLQETGRTAVEMAAVWARPFEWSAGLVDGVVGHELLEAAAGGGRGTVLLLPHLGNWEMFSANLERYHGFLALYRPARVHEVDRLILRARGRPSRTMVPATTGGVRRLLDGLRAGRLVVILPDQEPVQTAGEFAPFFGVPALTMTLVCGLLQRTGAVPLLGVAERGRRGRFTLRIQRAPEGLDDADLEVALGRLNYGVEQCVRACPEQYQWSYKRFRTRPAGELTPYAVRSFLPENVDRVDPVIRARLLGTGAIPRP